MAYDGSLRFDTRLDASEFQKGANRMTDIVKGMGVFKILEAGFTLIKNSVNAAFGRIDTMDQFNRVMTVMTGSTEITNKALDKTNSIVKGTAYGLDVAARSVQNFVSRGMDVSKATTTVEAWGDAVAFYGDGTNATFESVTTALSKMQTKGNVTMEHMQALFNAGIPALDIYASKVGMSTEEVSAQMSKGELKSADFIFALNEAFKTGAEGFPAIAGAAKEAGTSWAGTFDNMKAAVTRGTQAFIQAVETTAQAAGMPTVKSAVAGVGKFIESSMKVAAQAVVPLIKNMDLIAPAVITAAAAVTTYKVATLAATTVAKLANVEVGKHITMANLSAIADGLRTKAKTAMTIATGNATTALALLTAGEGTAATVGAMLTVKEAALAAVKGVLTGQIGLATAAQLIWNAAMAANPIGLIVAGIAVLVAGIIGLLVWVNRGSEEYRQQKAEVEALADKQEALSASVQDSAAAYRENVAAIDSNIQAGQNLLSTLRGMVDENGKLTVSHEDAQQVIRDLNKAYDGLNLSYDEETGCLSASVEELERYIDAKNSISKMSVLDERRVELASEQARVEAGLAEIEEKRRLISENGNLTEEEKRRLYKELDKTVQEYGETQDALALDIEANNAAIDASTDKMADNTVNAYEAVNGARTTDGLNLKQLAKLYDVTTEQILADMRAQGISMQEWADNNAALYTKDGLNIDQLAAKWGMTTEEVTAYMDEWGMGLDEFSDEMEATHTSAGLNLDQLAAKWGTTTGEIKRQMAEQGISMQQWSDNQDAKTQEVINSFKEIPGEYEQTADEMIAILQKNAERYSAWTENIATLSQTMSAESIAELQKLGPEANSAIEEMIADPSRAAEFEESILAVMSAGASGAEVGATDPRFPASGAQIDANMGEGVESSGEVEKAVVQTVERAATAAETAITSADFTGAGKQMIADVVSGIEENKARISEAVNAIPEAVDLSGVAEKMSSGFDAGSRSVTTTANAMKTTVLNTLRTMGAETATTVTQGVNQIATQYQTGSSRVTNTVNLMRNQVGAAMRSMSQEAINTKRSMWDTLASTAQAGATKVRNTVTNMKSAVLSTLRALSSEGKTAVSGMMDGMAARVNDNAGKFGQAMNNAMAGMLRSMNNHAGSLYAKADEIAAEIARRLDKGFDNRSPSHIMQRIFGNVMLGMLRPMVEKARLLYDQADEIVDELQERLQLEPEDFAVDMVHRVRFSLDAGQDLMAARLALAPAGAAGGMTIIYESHQDVKVESPKPMSEYELSRELADQDKRREWRVK